VTSVVSTLPTNTRVPLAATGEDFAVAWIGADGGWTGDAAKADM